MFLFVLGFLCEKRKGGTGQRENVFKNGSTEVYLVEKLFTRAWNEG